jgi:hypothetical protein
VRIDLWQTVCYKGAALLESVLYYQLGRTTMYTKRFVWTVVGCLLLLAGFATAQDKATKRVLTSEMAKKMADACEAAQAEGKWRPMNIAIYDAKKTPSWGVFKFRR